ncbi:MAG: 1,2-phenylacetyl-CoA epoxidase subunit PaaC [Burkholderiales bacterium]
MTSADRFEFLLRLGDNALVLGQRLSEWVGKGPILEEDIAMTNVGLDLIGQARLWLAYAGEVEGRGRDEDALAFRRDANGFRNALLVEQPNGDYADTMARQFLFDHWHLIALRALAESSDATVAAIAAKSAKEAAYHAERSTDWVIRLGDGTDESHARMQRAIDELWMYAGELFAPDPVDDAARVAGIGPDLAALAAPWRTRVDAALAEATLVAPADDWAQGGGRQGRHTEHLGHLLAEMQFLQRAYPDARW